MLSTGSALAWGLWRRHRWGLSITAATWVAVPLLLLALPPALWAEWLGADDQDTSRRAIASAIAVICIQPFQFMIAYLFAVFAYNFDMDIASRSSCYPPRMYTLPVRTAELAGWPMLHGVSAVALMWLVFNGGVLMPTQLLDYMVWWPAALLAVEMAWIQALTWTPFAWSWQRVIVGIPLLSLPPMIPIFGLQMFELPDGVVAALLAALVPVGYVAAYRGLARGRRGEAPEWTRLIAWWRSVARRRSRVRPPFASAARAQLWFEWQRHGFVLPLLVALVLPLVLLPLFLGTNDVMPAGRTLVTALLLPPFFAGMAASAVGKNNPSVRDFYGVTPFHATRPLSTAALVGVKLKMAALSTLAGWGVVLVVTTAVVLVTDTRTEVASWWREWRAAAPGWKIAATLILAASVLLVVTWKRLVENLVIGLTGREWIIKGSVFLGMFVFTIAAVIASYLFFYPEERAGLMMWLPVVVVVLVLVKLVLAGKVWTALLDTGLLPDRALRWWALAYVLLAGGLFALACLVVPPEIPRRFLAMIVFLVVPLVRPAAAPLALAWNRHR